MSKTLAGVGSSERPHSKSKLNQNRLYRRFVIPSLLLLLLLTLIPILMTFGLSLSSLSFSSAAPTGYVGLRNYLRLFEDARFINSIRVSILLIAIPVALQMLFGFLIALVMSQQLKGLGWLRLIFVAPMVLPPIVMGLMWKVLFTPQLGGINYFLSLVGLEGPSWLTEPNWALTAIIITALWGWTPFVALMFLTAMETFPKELYDAASIDGASWFQTVRHIMIPLLKPTATVVLVFRIIEALAIFPIIFVVTGGGPAGSTETVNYYAYVNGFNFLKIAYASAIIFIFFLLLVSLITPALWSIASSVEER